MSGVSQLYIQQYIAGLFQACIMLIRDTMYYAFIGHISGISDDYQGYIGQLMTNLIFVNIISLLLFIDTEIFVNFVGSCLLILEPYFPL